jgi:metal-responsive CopG/Arc/MetJ family transcriptional regulator
MKAKINITIEEQLLKEIDKNAMIQNRNRSNYMESIIMESLQFFPKSDKINKNKY